MKTSKIIIFIIDFFIGALVTALVLFGLWCAFGIFEYILRVD